MGKHNRDLVKSTRLIKTRKRNDAGALIEYCEDFYYVMKEMRVKDRVAYEDRDDNRLNRRRVLGLGLSALYID